MAGESSPVTACLDHEEAWSFLWRARPVSLRPMSAIEASGLTKTFRTYKKEPGLRGAVKGLFRRRYETVTAVNDVSFRIEEGELVGFLGPNGAGKTTTLKMLAGLLYPAAGTARVPLVGPARARVA